MCVVTFLEMSETHLHHVDMIFIFTTTSFVYRFTSQMCSESRLVTTRREMGHANFATLQSSWNHCQEVHVRAPRKVRPLCAHKVSLGKRHASME